MPNEKGPADFFKDQMDANAAAAVETARRMKEEEKSKPEPQVRPGKQGLL